MTPRLEKFLTAKEIAAEFERRGIPMHVDYARAIIRELDARGLAVRGKYARFSDCWDFWVLTPGWMPFSRKADRSVGQTVGLAKAIKGIRLHGGSA